MADFQELCGWPQGPTPPTLWDRWQQDLWFELPSRVVVDTPVEALIHFEYSPPTFSEEPITVKINFCHTEPGPVIEGEPSHTLVVQGHEPITLTTTLRFTQPGLYYLMVGAYSQDLGKGVKTSRVIQVVPADVGQTQPEGGAPEIMPFGTVTVKHTLHYLDRDGVTIKPAVGLKVEVSDYDAPYFDLLSIGFTDANGYFEVTLNNWDSDIADPNSKLDLFVDISTENTWGKVTAFVGMGEPYYWDTYQGNVDDGDYVYSQTLSSSDSSRKAIWIYQDLRRAWNWMPGNPGYLDIYWQNGTTCLPFKIGDFGICNSFFGLFSHLVESSLLIMQTFTLKILSYMKSPIIICTGRATTISGLT